MNQMPRTDFAPWRHRLSFSFYHNDVIKALSTEDIMLRYVMMKLANG